LGKKLYITEKPSVAASFAEVLGHENYKTGQKQGICRVGALSGNMVFWPSITMAYPDAYDPKYRNGRWKISL